MTATDRPIRPAGRAPTTRAFGYVHQMADLVGLPAL